MIKAVRLLCFLSAISFLAASPVAGAEITIKDWGIDSRLYKEIDLKKQKQTGVDFVCMDKKFRSACDRDRFSPKFRFFESLPERTQSPVAQRCSELTMRVAQRLQPPGDPDAFLMKVAQEKQKSNPECAAWDADAAPQLYFDLQNSAASPAILDAIKVTNFAWTEFAGGGFSYDKQTYSLWISTKPGTETFLIKDNKLTLKPNDVGQLKLKLFSTNIRRYLNVAMNPEGIFFLDIELVFSVGNKTASVKSPKFLIVM